MAAVSAEKSEDASAGRIDVRGLDVFYRIDDAKRQCCPADHLREDGPGDEGGKQC